jgi:lisH domain-containing protein FOPNL
MDSLANLGSIVKDSLEKKGVMKELKAHVRAEVYHTLEDKSTPCPKKPQEGPIFLASELLRDYLMSLELRNTLSVYLEEGGQPVDTIQIDRHFIGEELGINLINYDSNVPLLMILIEHLQGLKGANTAEKHDVSDSLQVQGFEYEG